MSVAISVTWRKAGVAALQPGPFKRAAVRALRKAGSTALRDMRSEARKRIKARKRIGAKYITRAITLRRASGTDIASMSWSVDVSGEQVPFVAYPYRQTKQGVSVEVNRGKRTLLKGAFVATMDNGHVGIFKRTGKARLPIQELRGSRPVDALLHAGEAQGVAERYVRVGAATRGGQVIVAPRLRAVAWFGRNPLDILQIGYGNIARTVVGAMRC